MRKTWKKRLTNPAGMRAVLALLYLLVSSGIPLGHTCQLVDKVHHCYSKGTNHRHEDHSLTEIRLAPNQSNCDNKNQFHRTHCSACLYSLNSKTSKLCSNISLCTTQTVLINQVPAQFSFTKQLEWFYSAPLRAPPSIAS